MPLFLRALLTLLILTGPAPAIAETAPAAPAPLTQKQFDGLVDALTQAVAKKLEQKQLAPAPVGADTSAARSAEADTGQAPPAAQAPPMMDMGANEQASQMVIGLLERTGAVFMALPLLPGELARIPALLGHDNNEGRGFGHFLLLLAAAAVAALVAEAAVHRLARPLQRHLAARVRGAAGLWPLVGLAGIDAVGVAVLWLAGYGLFVTGFPGFMPQDRLAYLALTSLVYWRLYMMVFRIALRPDIAQARLAEVDDADARSIYRCIAASVFVAIILSDIFRILVAIHTPPDVVASLAVINAVVIAGLFIGAALRVGQPVARWLRGLSCTEQAGAVQTLLADNWLAIAIPLFVALGFARIYGAIMDQTGTHEALVLTLNVLIGLLLIESLMGKAQRLTEGLEEPGREVPLQRQRAIEAVMRCLRLALYIGAAELVIHGWTVNAIGMMDSDAFSAFARPAVTVGATLFAAFCVWQLLDFITGAYIHQGRSGQPGGHDTEEGAAGTGSRLGTLMPLLRVALLIALVIMAGLTALSQLGVNITPLIAGASIAGLAVSFGSQTLVRDIVSGIFYLVDDAFRVGEYIDCGKAKGTVEGFTLRSLKLRHQNGMVHTIPFGQLGQITNFSRDWATMKFNLRFARNTDVEKLRKVVKKIGQDMLEDPELKDEFLVPLKMQGVADIADNALVVRFKFTVRPVRPTLVQREAIKRMIRALPEAGVEFATNMVSVQALGGSAESAAAAAAAANQRARAAAEAAALAANG